MLDPIGTFETICDNFILYIKTAFRTRYPSLETERERLLRGQNGGNSSVFHREPWIEPIPAYLKTVRLADLPLEVLPSFDASGLKEFSEFCSIGLVGNNRLYLHQEEMLRLAASG